MSDALARPSPSFLTLDSRVPAAIGDLLIEADGCVEHGFLTGGTACARSAVRELLAIEKAAGADIDAQLRDVGEKWPSVPQALITILRHLADTSRDDSSKVDDQRLRLLTVTLKAIVYEIYVLGPERTERLTYVRELAESLTRSVPA